MIECNLTSSTQIAAEVNIVPGSIRISPRLKRLLVPCWNEVHRLSWSAYDYLNAFGHGRLERCIACGRFGPMLYRRRVVRPRLEELWGLSPRLAEALARKESCDCAYCGAKLRGRRLVQVLLGLYPVGIPPAPARCLADWVNQPEIQAIRIAEINVIDGVHDQLRKLPNVALSDYVPDSRPGAANSETRSEDLTRLTYADSTFDLVLTSETLEHVPDLNAALRELRRVLVPSGRHIFTVPVLPGVSRTFARSVISPDGSIEDRAARICHPGGDVGYPVFTEFGADLPELLERSGFEIEEHFGPPNENDLAQVYVARAV
jgi:SAM-dependent methyltransferase